MIRAFGRSVLILIAVCTLGTMNIAEAAEPAASKVASPGAATASSQAAMTTPKVISHITLPKGGFINLQVLDSYKENRTFLVTCEKALDSKIVNALLTTGVGYHPLKKKEKQSLINYWQSPATDYVIACEG